MVSAVFRFSERNLLGGAAQKIRPGDVVSVDQTPETRTRKTLAQVFRVVIGAELYGNVMTPVGSSN